MTPSIDQAERLKIISARINAGTDSYAGRLDAWHELGNVIGRFATLEEITVAAKLDATIFKSQLRDGLGRPVDAYGTFWWDAIDKAAGDTSKSRFLGTVGKDYTVIPHTSGAELLDALVGSLDGAHYETAGYLDAGKVVWYQINPNFAIRVGEDVTDILLSVITSHDGSKAFEIYETGVRQVCRNTVRIGQLKKLTNTIRLKHTKSATGKLADLKQGALELKDAGLAMQDKLVYLASKRVTRESANSIFNRLFPPVMDADGKPKESQTRRENVLSAILARFESNDNNAFPEQAGSSYALLNAITGYTDHERATRTSDGATSKARAESAVFGSGDALKRSALDLILAEAKDMPTLTASRASIPVDWSELGITPTASAPIMTHAS